MFIVRQLDISMLPAHKRAELLIELKELIRKRKLVRESFVSNDLDKQDL